MRVLTAPLLAGALLLAGCGGEPVADSPKVAAGSTAPADSTTASLAPPSLEADSATTAAESAYLQDVRASGMVADYTDQVLLVLGHSACRTLDEGASPAGMILSARENGEGDAGTAVIVTATTTLCREHLPAIRELGEAGN